MIIDETVPLGQWHRAAERAYSAGNTMFDLLTAVDQMDDSVSPGIDVVLHVWSGGRSGGVWLRTRWHEGLRVRSCADVWAGAAWHEREVQDMFGIPFDGLTTNEPLLLPPDCLVSPLRKAFPLGPRTDRPWPGSHEPRGGTSTRLQAPGAPRQQEAPA